jgi:DNA-binding transcriptional LysR family regulator
MSSKNPISIEILEILDAIDRRGSFAKAAEELNKATSALSYALQKLEEQLGIALFQRQGRRSVLTPAGQLILDEGRVILANTAKLVDTAKELATGWEPRIRIALESTQSSEVFFQVLAQFLEQHANVEIDVCESVLNGGWEALEQGRVELLVGAPGPVPLQKGFRTTVLGPPDLRRVITHDTSRIEISRSEGLIGDGQKCYVQNMEQKVAAITAGIGIGHLPYKRIRRALEQGSLIKLNLPPAGAKDTYLAWKISNKGKGLQALIGMINKAYALA